MKKTFIVQADIVVVHISMNLIGRLVENVKEVGELQIIQYVNSALIHPWSTIGSFFRFTPFWSWYVLGAIYD